MMAPPMKVESIEVDCPFCDANLKVGGAEGGVAILVCSCGLVIEIRVLELPHPFR